MFSASLLAIMIHSLPPPARGVFPGWSGDSPGEGSIFNIPFDTGELDRRFLDAVTNFSGPWPRIPVVAHARDWEMFPRLESLAKSSNETADPNRGFIWGRIPLDYLIRHYLAVGTVSADRENFDLGTPVRDVSAAAAGASVSALQTFLAMTPSAGAFISTAVVDRGDPATGLTGAPNNFGGKLQYSANPTGAVMSSHAEQVLEVMLDRLNRLTAPNIYQTAAAPGASPLNMLGITAVSMGLMVSPSQNQVQGGKGCFDQHCAPELLTAVQNMDAHLNGIGLPAVINISQGTNVGPHNGESPLEAYISNTLYTAANRFVFAAAGNEGDAGVSSRVKLKKAGETDYMTIIADGTCTELLVEFWWDDATGPDVEIAAEISSTGFRPASIRINPKAKGISAVLQQPPSGRRPPVTFLTLLKSTAKGSMSCISFAATRPSVGPEFKVSFGIKANAAPVPVQSWIVILDAGMKTRFTRGGPEGTVCAPASGPNVVSVAGFDGIEQQMWIESSRGPACDYGSPNESPVMAHLVAFPGTVSAAPGTSFASPRAAADAAVPLSDPARRAKCTDVPSLLHETYPAATTTWDERYGFHKQTS